MVGIWIRGFGLEFHGRERFWPGVAGCMGSGMDKGVLALHTYIARHALHEAFLQEVS